MFVIDHCYYQTLSITKYILEKYIQCAYVCTYEITSSLLKIEKLKCSTSRCKATEEFVGIAVRYLSSSGDK